MKVHLEKGFTETSRFRLAQYCLIWWFWKKETFFGVLV